MEPIPNSKLIEQLVQAVIAAEAQRVKQMQLREMNRKKAIELLNSMQRTLKRAQVVKVEKS